MRQARKFKTFFNPAGFIEQHYIGAQTPESVIAAIEELVKTAQGLKNKNQPVLILADVTSVPKIDVSGKMAGVRKQAVKAMNTANYDRLAVYGNFAVQILVNTLVLIAGKKDKIKVFANRVDALHWLKNG